MDIAVPHLVSGGRLDVKADAERGRCGEAAHCQAGEHEEAPVRQGGVKSERLSCRRRSLGRLLLPHILADKNASRAIEFHVIGTERGGPSPVGGYVRVRCHQRALRCEALP